MTHVRHLALPLLLVLTVLWGTTNAQSFPDTRRFNAPVTIEAGSEGMPLRAALNLLATAVDLTPVLEGVDEINVRYDIPEPRPFRQVWDLVLSLQDLDYRLMDGNIVVVGPSDVVSAIGSTDPAPEATESAPPIVTDQFYDLPRGAEELQAVLEERFANTSVALLPDAEYLVVSAPVETMGEIDDFVGIYTSRVDGIPAPQPEEPDPETLVDRRVAYYQAAQDVDALAEVIAQEAPTAGVTTLPDTGAIAVYGSDEEHRAIRAAVDELHAFQEATREEIQQAYFTISYGNGETIFETLENSLENEEDGTHTISYDSEARTIVVTGSQDVLRRANEIVANLDQQQQQVSVQVRIQEVTKDAEERLGIDLASDVGLLAMNFATTGLNFILDPAAGFTSMNVNATLDTLEQQNLSQNVQDAHLTLKSGATGTFNSGGRIDLVLGSGDSDQEIRTVDYGTLIEVTPVVTRDGSISLDIAASVSGFEGELSRLTGLDLSSRAIETEVIAQNGQALVMGGLLQNSVEVNETGVPLLSSIPLIGSLFRSTTNTEETTDVMVVVKATITPPAE